MNELYDPRDTIAAVATPPGMGGIAIVRVSGEKALAILKKAFVPARGGKISVSRMHYGHAIGLGGEIVDEAMAVYFRAPNSYTREDVCEIHLHGGRLSSERVMKHLFTLGARCARPGEFTRRAFLNGRIDLAQAEAVMSLLSAGSELTHRASVRQLAGGVSALIGRAREELIDLLSLIDACADYPEEMDEKDIETRVLARARAVRDTLARHADPRAARIMFSGASVVIVGRPNVGKSSLMNAITNLERAIVTDIPGTTRDVLTETVSAGGASFRLSDTAGQRDTDDAVERLGVRRARDAEDGADVVLMVLDAAEPLCAEDDALLSRADGRWIAVLNKCDLLADARPRLPSPARDCPVVEVSAKTGAGIDDLISRIVKIIGADAFLEDQMTLPRHIECAGRAICAIDRAIDGLQNAVPLDFAAVELNSALAALGDITGDTLNESVIDRVFENFCVGK